MTAKQAEGPLVSVVLAVRDEAPYLPRCLDALAAQTYPHDRIEVIVADGGSTDGSDAIARGWSADGLTARVLDNPSGIAPAGFNLGVRNALGEVIIILGARAEVAPDFVSESVAALERTGADAVGGVVASRAWDEARSATARAIALALRSPFGVGDARYRYATREQEVDTVNYGAYRRDVFERVGLFDESLAWVEDDELNYRLRAAGGRLVLSPAIRVCYYARPSLGALWRQQFRWGLNKPKVARRHPAQMRPRHAVPALFVGTIVVTGLMAPFNRRAGRLQALTLGAYALASAVATLHAARQQMRSGMARPQPPTCHEPQGRQRRDSGPGAASRNDLAPDLAALLRLPLAFATMHVAYGTGMLLGLARLIRPDRPAALPPSASRTLRGVPVPGPRP